MYTRQIGLDDGKYLNGLKEILNTIKKEGPKISIQSFHGGRRI
jgi:2,4-dienoyl-CoA reductase-like NADH-dependent reductase (Old Yellow Enzyme family)